MDAIQNKKTCLVYRSQKDKRSNVWSYLLYQHHQHQQSLDYTRSCTSHCTIYIIILLNHWNICIHICLTLLLMSSPINQFLTSDYTIPLSSISPSIIHQSNIRVNTSYHTIYTIINQFHTSDIYMSSPINQFLTSDYTIPSSIIFIRLIYIHLIILLIQVSNIWYIYTSDYTINSIYTIIKHPSIKYWCPVSYVYTIPSSFNFIRLIILLIAFISSSNIHQSNIGVQFHIICTIINQCHTSDSYIYTIINQSISISHWNIIQFHTSDYTILIPFIPLIPSSNIHQSNIGIQFHTSILYHHHSISYVWYIFVWLYY